MILKDLIDIYYSPAILNNTQKYESIKNTIDNIEIDNVLNNFNGTVTTTKLNSSLISRFMELKDA